MIEALLSDVCTDCGACVEACPDDVFDRGESQPVIARQSDCQTCFLCEAYCPVDALYVSPLAQPDANFDVDKVRAAGLFGSFRRSVRWSEGAPLPPDPNRVIARTISYQGDPSDKIRVGLAMTRNKSFVDPSRD